KKINIRRMYYLFRHKYLTLNNVVIAIAFMIATGWVWGSLDVMQRNYALQKNLLDKQRQLIVAELNYENANLEKRYYQTDEYKELAVRQRLGLGMPGESVLILPPNSEAAKNADDSLTAETETETVETGNFEQWVNFLFGANNKRISS
ncbi:MAG: hypothetical protein PHO93_00990, partial [Candidatus Saccharimonadaceae bacterium]|nr:hypothetical protein [Candidatus Saccharimonadaceae bacterium]